MSADSLPQVERSPAGWFLSALTALVVCGAAGVLLDQRLVSHILPHRWGPNAGVPLERASREIRDEANAQFQTTSMQGGAIALGVLAASLALGLGLVNAIKLKSRKGMALAVVGTAAAGAAGAGGGYLAMQLHEKFEKASNVSATTTEAIMIQASGWVCAGLGVAFAVWLVSARYRSFWATLLGGALAGALIGLVYPPVVSLLFPDINTDRLFPDSGMYPRTEASGYTWAFVFWVVFTGVLFAVVLAGVGRTAPKPAVETPPPAEPIVG